jgi:hypothetical protein
MLDRLNAIRTIFYFSCASILSFDCTHCADLNYCAEPSDIKLGGQNGIRRNWQDGARQPMQSGVKRKGQSGARQPLQNGARQLRHGIKRNGQSGARQLFRRNDTTQNEQNDIKLIQQSGAYKTQYIARKLGYVGQVFANHYKTLKLGACQLITKCSKFLKKPNWHANRKNLTLGFALSLVLCFGTQNIVTSSVPIVSAILAAVTNIPFLPALVSLLLLDTIANKTCFHLAYSTINDSANVNKLTKELEKFREPLMYDALFAQSGQFMQVDANGKYSASPPHAVANGNKYTRLLLPYVASPANILTPLSPVERYVRWLGKLAWLHTLQQENGVQNPAFGEWLVQAGKFIQHAMKS